MHILTDAGADLTPGQRAGLVYDSVPLTFTLDGKSYRSGIDIGPEAFYELLSGTASFPSTSQPSPGEFADAYRRLITDGDRDVLSIHISSGLSGTLNAARLGAQQVSEANVTFVDTLTLSGAEGWVVEAACRMNKAGWPLSRMLPILEKISGATETLYTLDTLKYLEHGGRISHIQALLGQILDLKPIIGVEKELGKYAVHSRERSLKKAVTKIAEMMAAHFSGAGELRVMVLHGHNAPAAEELMKQIGQRVNARFLPIGPIAPVLGAHTGPTLVGACAAPMAVFEGIPGIA